MTVYMSSGAFRTRKLAEVISEAKRLGVTHIELSSGLEHEPRLRECVDEGMAQGLTFLVHNYFPAPAEPKVLNLTASDEADLRWSIDHCRSAIDLSCHVGCDFYSLHAGYIAALKPQHLGKPEEQARILQNATIDYDKAYDLMIRSVREVADYAAPLGKQLLIENNVISPLYLERVPTNPLLMTYGDEIVRFMKDVDRSNVGFLIDMGHVKVSGTALGFDPQDFLTKVKPYIRALHISDNNGREDENLPVDENSWFYPRLSEFKGMPWVIEAYRLDDATMLQQLNLLKRL